MRNKEHRRASQYLISVIDDDQCVRAALSNLLHSAGYETCGFDSAEAFLASDCLPAASCAIMDVKLKGMSGFELKEHLISLHVSLPVIFISGHSPRFANERAAQLGAVAFLDKPIKADTLLTHIRRVTIFSGGQE
jgi:FixJ family two-component response regulator